ncbi:unnamed protein product [Vicia faba]|uniref:aldehyde dehydrogenase (NAD(+)) n=1 Tax=Vicia faba TaxID=3906 RepID=A0AAV1AGN6_VICFA|nr:unnamed protein product [Vicia faba]
MASSIKISRLISRSISSASSSTLFSRGGNGGYRGGLLAKYSTAVVVDEQPIKPLVQVEHIGLLIDGKFVDAASGKTFPTLDLRTGEVIAHVVEGHSEDIDMDVAAARKAFDIGPWPKMTTYERQKIMLHAADLIEKHNDEIATLETWDNGKPYEQSRQVEISMLTLHEPIGVAGQIIPWNFPLLMFAWKVGPALACGNTVVMKTAEQTPLSVLYTARLFLEAGLPPGVLNIVSGFGPTAGAALASHMDVDKVAFTGSTATGKFILQLAAQSNLKQIRLLELGGKSPFIVCEDADVDQAVELAHFALFFNQGQCCCAGSRTFVHERVCDEFVEKAKIRALNRSVGDPFKSGIEQGPQIDSKQFEKILRYIRSGVDTGATLETGGERHASKGYYIQPTVFSDVQDDMPIAKEEIFGPVQTILKFKNNEDVIQRENNSKYGLAAGIFTQNIDTANTLTRALKVGTIWVNCYDVFDATIPFGGIKTK